MAILPTWLQNILPILVLLGAISLVLWRLPKVELGHSRAFKVRRFWNWFPLGMTYAFLYFARYNINRATDVLPGTTNEDFGIIFFWGTATYGVSFLINGPLADRLGGRTTILLSAMGAFVANMLMGLVIWGAANKGWQLPGGIVGTLAALYSVNMYFQSFGAVSIVKVNAQWFHVRERGVLGGVFGILISLGIYFAFDWSKLIVNALPVEWVFFIPAGVLLILFVVEFFLVRDTPADAGFKDFDTADASSGDTGPPLGVKSVFVKMISNPVIVVILLVEFCSGFLRQAVMNWGPKFATQTGLTSFVFQNWGMVLCVSGILGGMFAGVISDKVFGSRRGPVSAVLYSGLSIGTVVTFFLLGHPAIGWAMAWMSLCVIGVHGMLSGTASMDFGGKKNAGVAVGIIDGAVYAGTAVQAILYAKLLPQDKVLAANPANWVSWPVAMIPVALIGTALALKLWNARPQKAAPPKVLEPVPAASAPGA